MESEQSKIKIKVYSTNENPTLIMQYNLFVGSLPQSPPRFLTNQMMYLNPTGISDSVLRYQHHTNQQSLLQINMDHLQLSSIRRTVSVFTIVLFFFNVTAIALIYVKNTLSCFILLHAKPGTWNSCTMSLGQEINPSFLLLALYCAFPW